MHPSQQYHGAPLMIDRAGIDPDFDEVVQDHLVSEDLHLVQFGFEPHHMIENHP